MAIQISENDVTVKYTDKIGKGQLVAECGIDMSAGGVSKIYCVSGGVNVKSAEAQERAVKVVCEVTTRVIYADGAGAVANADYVTEVTGTVAAEGAVAGMNVYACAGISDIQSEVVGSSLKVQTVLDIDFEGECEYTAPLVDDVQGAVTRTQDIKAVCLKGGGSDAFTVTEEYEAGGAIGKILSYGAEVFLTSVRAEEGSVYAEGEVWIQLVYDDGGICSKQFSHPFAEELMISGSRADLIATARACVKGVSILITGSEEENVVQTDVTVGVDVKLYEEEEIEVVADVFSPAAELEVSFTEKSYLAPVGMKFISKRVCGSADIQAEGIRRVLAGVPSFASVSNMYREGAKLVCEGVLNVCQIYETDGGAVDSCAVEIPFSFSCDLKDDAENQIECTGVAVTDVVSRVRREGETEVCASISLQLECKINCAVYGVGHIEVGQERELDMGGISVFTVAKGETLWDAAKALNVSERDIISQNSFAEKGVKEGDKIVVFRCMG